MNPKARGIESAPGAEQFVHRMTRILNDGALSIMISIGHRLGLFDTLAGLEPSTSKEIAATAGLSERYVREWLAAMVVGNVTSYEPTSNTYYLPRQHAACLTKRAPLGNLAVYAQSVALAGAVQDQVLECFRTGKGLQYSEYPCFHTIMAEDSGQTVVENIEDALDTLVPDVLPKLDRGIEVLDAGCGAGQALLVLAKRFPNSSFIGYDFCDDAIKMAQKAASELHLNNVRFSVVDLADWEEEAVFDFITSFDAVHDTKNPETLLRQICRALRPNGIHLMQDIAGSECLENNINFPFAALLYTISTVHCTPVSIGQGGAGLGTMWGWETAERMLRDAGFNQCTRSVLPHDPMNVWFVSRK